MNKNFRFTQSRTARAMILLLVMLLATTTAVFAITIAIDGVQDAVWTTGAGGQLPGAETDSDEPLITNGVDIETIRYTNDDTYYYILIDTFADTTTTQPGPDPYVVICFDTDNNASTGESFINCDGSSGVSMDGIERIVEVNLSTSSFTVFQGDYATTIATSNPSDVATATEITEFRVPLADLGLDSSQTCNGPMQMNVYFDGQTTDPDDNMPDNGTFTATCGSPTAVTLLNTNADGEVGVLPFSIAGIALLGLVSVGLLVYRKRQVGA